MGLYNEIYVDCPECGKHVVFQSKSGSCTLTTYHITRMPSDDLAGIVGDECPCENCGYLVQIGKPIPFNDYSWMVK